MKIIIVGNSDKNLSQESGNLIDAFDIVVRFNDYKIGKFKKYVGGKTDYIWLSNPFLRLAQNRTDVKYLTYSRYRGNARYNRHLFEFLEPYEGKLESNQSWSSGISVIFHFMNKGDVTVTGICDGGKSHYWDKQFKVYGKHKLGIEEKLLKGVGVKRLHE